MKRALWFALWLAAAGCSLDDLSGALLGAAKGAEKPELEAESAEPAPLVESVYLGEWLAFDGVRCRVEEAERALTEAREPPPGQRLRPDVDVLWVKVRCENQGGKAVQLADALPSDTSPRLRLHAHPPSAPSVRTVLSDRDPKALVFELPAQADALPNPRSFHAQTGAPYASPRYGSARLSFESLRARSEVVLRKRELTPLLDAWLAQTASSLASGAESTGAHVPSGIRGSDRKAAATGDREPPTNAEANAAFDNVRALYRDALKKLDPERLTLVELTSDPQGRPLATLALDRARRGAERGPVLSLRFALEPGPDGAFRTAQVDTLHDARGALACSDDDAVLRTRARKQAPKQALGAARCNVLGLLLPGRCEHLAEDLREAALRLQLRCVPGLHGLLREKGRPLPEDFLLTLRRGRARSALDAAPRYVLSLYANGSVVFHGRSFVHSTERSDGRTSPKLLRGLFARLEALAWFERRGGSWNAKTCSAKDSARDVFTVHAGSRERMVLDREGCRGPFSAKELAQLREWTEQVAGVSGWTAPDSADEDASVTEWVVTAD